MTRISFFGRFKYICIDGFGTMDDKGITKKQFWLQMFSAGFNLLLGIVFLFAFGLVAILK